MTRYYALEAIRAQPWAILPAHLGAIEAIAARALEAPAVELLRADGHAERYQQILSAVADTGDKMAGTQRVTLNRQGVATLPIMGPIFPSANMMTNYSGATDLASLSSDFAALQSSGAVSQILLVVDSPGGVTTGINAMAEQIAASSKPVTVYVPGMAASAAYWLASQAGSIVMDPTAMVGSIGVVMSGSQQVQPDEDGRMSFDIVSSNAPNKRPDLTSDDGQAEIRTVLDDIESIFVSTIAKGRGVSADTVKQNFGKGGLKVAKSAISAGMADSTGTLADTIARLGAAKPLPSPAKSTPRRAQAMADLEERRKKAQGS
ncbi:peptidase [Acetobacter malorum]|uniref:Peptidase n=1 Tax=Acetobacter malorum TaxID=178901 RepID=A0A149USG8_9PROT|nr:S49 family peptidase [Acetobacter malorum]KXV70857.1 peptidase [Acetobacter malorum]